MARVPIGLLGANAAVVFRGSGFRFASGYVSSGEWGVFGEQWELL